MKRIKSGIILVLLLVLSVAFVGCSTAEQDNYNLEKVSNAYITLDINPSIEIITDEAGLVDQVNGLNDDAIRLLVDQDFKGQTVDTTLNAILQLAIDFGYIDFDLENAVLITAGAETGETTEELETQVSEKVKAFIEKRKMNVEVLKASLEATEGIKAIAEQYNISVGKVKVITYAMAMDSELTLEVAAEMPIRDLNKIIREGRNEVREFYSEEVRNTYFASKNQIKLETELAVKELLNAKIQAATDDLFAEVLVNSEATVEQVKALYQEYYDAILAVELPAEQVETVEPLRNQINLRFGRDNKDEDHKPVLDAEEQARYDELLALRETLSKELEDLIGQVKNKENELTEEELQTALNRMKEIILERTEVIVEMNQIRATAAKEGLENRFDFKFEGKWNDGKYGDDDEDEDEYEELEDLYKEVKQLYEGKFEELGIDLEDLEEAFKVLYEAEINELIETKRLELAEIHETFKVDSRAIRDQIKEENEILRKIWKK